MFSYFELTAIIEKGKQVKLLRIPMHQNLQKEFAESWRSKCDDFLNDIQELEFNVGYTLEEHERFIIKDFILPDWLAHETISNVHRLDSIGKDEGLFGCIKGIAGIAQDKESDKEFILFQNFTRSHAIRPGTYLFLESGTYRTNERTGLTLRQDLSAVYIRSEQKLVFRNFRAVNTFLPLGDYYREVSEEQILEILSHSNFMCRDAESFAKKPTEWYRKRFAMLSDSKILEKFSAKALMEKAKKVNFRIDIEDNKIVFPKKGDESKKLLQFLNEELYRGAITEDIYETNSKRKAD